MRAPSLLLLVVLVAGCVAPAAPPATDVPPTVRFEAVEFTTEHGAMTVLLYPEAAPETVALVKAYVAEGYYVGRAFNRTVPGHVIQVLDVTGASEDARRVPLETHEAYHFSMGAAGIARGEDPNSGGPEFFVMDFATSHLDGNFTVWGQVYNGMDVVHRIARVPALDGRPHPAVPLLAFDRLALDPPVITAARLTTVDVPAEDAERIPYVVAKNVRLGDFRHSADWPANLRAKEEAALGWYVRPYNATAPPAAADVRILVGDEQRPVTEDPDAPGAFSWTWTPPSPGIYSATLAWKGEPTATLKIVVPE